MKTTTIIEQKIRAIYHRFAQVEHEDGMNADGFRVYTRWPEYELSIVPSKTMPGKLIYWFYSYRGMAKDRAYTLPVESIDKIDVSENTLWLDEQLDQLETLYENSEIVQMKKSWENLRSKN